MLYSRLIVVILNFFDYFQQKKIIELIKKKFARPIVIFDVGAHHGETIRLFHKKLKMKKIYSFEPSPKNFEILDKTSVNLIKIRLKFLILVWRQKFRKFY